MPAPRFGVADRPGDILDGAGRWLAAELGWRWVKSRRDVDIRHGSRVLRLGLQSSTWSRSGVATWVSARVTVLDTGLTRWRKAWPESTVFPPSASPARPCVYSSLLINVEGDLADVECSGLPRTFPAPRMPGLDEFAAGFRVRVLPVLDLFKSPRLVAQEMPDSWLSMVDCGTIEWALTSDDRDAAALLLKRHLERPLRDEQSRGPLLERFRRGWELAPGRDGLPQVLAWATEPLGWLARVHDLLDPATLSESLPPPP
jgi:hypothetical protein